MGQVPQIRNQSFSYCIIGDGRLSRHLQFWLSHLGCDIKTASRRLWRDGSWLEYLQKQTEKSDVILLAVSDTAVGELAKNLRNFTSKPLVSFAGARTYTNVSTWHPLGAFSHQLFDLKQYDSIAFIGTSSSLPFSELFPALTNSSFVIEESQLKLYHASCVLASNFTTILWGELANIFKKDLQIQPSLAAGLLSSTAENILCGLKSNDPSRFLTGPLARGDLQTVSNNLEALSGKGSQKLYQSFVEFFREGNPL